MDSGSKIQCYRRDTPIENDCMAAALYTVQPDRYKTVSTFQANIKAPTLKKEARRGYKFTTLIFFIIASACIQHMYYQIRYNQHQFHKSQQASDRGVQGTEHQIVDTETKRGTEVGRKTSPIY